MSTELCHDSYSDHHSISKAPVKSIMKYLENLPIPEDIKLTANTLYQQVLTKNHRGMLLLQLIFVCVYKAYELKGLKIDSTYLADLIRLPKEKRHRAMDTFESLLPGGHTSNNTVSPLDLVPHYCRVMKLPDTCIDPVILIGSRIIEKDNSILEHPPRTIAASMVIYMCQLSTIKYDINQISDDVGISRVTLNKHIKELKKIDNS